MLLVDGDIIVYKVGFATEGQPLKNALFTAKAHVKNLLRDTDEEEAIIYLTGKGNFREEVCISTLYKAKRSKKPTHYHEIKEYLIDYMGAIEVTGMEADDALSIDLYCNEGDVLCSPDKDLLNTPGLHFNPMKPHLGVFDVSEREATRHFYYQLLLGDRTDNIPGLPACTEEIIDKYDLSKHALKGCGKKTAKQLMGEPTEDLLVTFNRVYECYLSYFEGDIAATEKYLNEQGQLLWMIRELDLDDKPIMWNIDYECNRH
jgi:DNA polymerase-1